MNAFQRRNYHFKSLKILHIKSSYHTLHPHRPTSSILLCSICMLLSQRVTNTDSLLRNSITPIIPQSNKRKKQLASLFRDITAYGGKASTERFVATHSVRVYVTSLAETLRSCDLTNSCTKSSVHRDVV
jgi:hypothetical protein